MNPLIISNATLILLLAIPTIYFLISAAMLGYARSELRNDKWWTWVSCFLVMPIAYVIVTVLHLVRRRRGQQRLSGNIFGAL